MLNKFFIESYIRWSGIDNAGHIHADLFFGSKSEFKKHIKQHNMLITQMKHEFRFKKNERLTKSIYNFTKDLGAILKTGVNLIDALQMLTYRYSDAHIKNIISSIITKLHAGHRLSDALSSFPECFSNSYVQLIKAGEMTQQLATIFLQLAMLQDFTSDLKNKIKKALIYPTCVLLFSLFITAGLVIFAIPQFKSIFENFNATLPTSTQTILNISHFISHNILLIFMLMLSSPLFLILLYKKLFFIKSAVQALWMHTPWIGALYRNHLIANWSYIMSLCTQAHLPLPQCLKLANASLSYLPIQHDQEKLVELLNAGNTLYEALATIALLSPSELYLIRVGEQSHTLQHSFERLSDQAFSHIAQSLGNLSKWLEPVIMLLLAVMAGGLIISMYLPIFKIGAIL